VGKTGRVNIKIRAMARDRLPYINTIGGCVFLLLAVAHAFVLPERMRDLMVPLAVFSAVGLFFMLWFQKRSGQFKDVLVYPFCCLTFGSFVANSMLHVGLSGEIHHTTNVMLCVIGCTVFINSFPLGILAITLSAGWWWAVTRTLAGDPLFFHFAIGIATASIVGVAFLGAGIRQARRIASNEIDLEDREVLLKAISDAAEDALIIVKDQLVIGGNQKWYQLTGRAMSEIGGTDLKSLFHARHWDAVSRILRSSDNGHFETALTDGKGGEVPVGIRFKSMRVDTVPVLALSIRVFDPSNTGNNESSIRTLASGVAHEINNPLTIITGHVALMQRLIQDDSGSFAQKIRPGLEVIHTSLARITKTVSSLMRLGSAGSAQLRQVTIDEVLAAAISLTGQRFMDSGVKIHTVNTAQGVFIPTRGQEIMTAVIALLENSLDAVRKQKAPEIALNAFCEGEFVIMRVIDSGERISDHTVTKLFTPFFSTKPPGQGQGLALSVAKKQIAEHGGSLEYIHDAAKTTFEIRLPIWSGQV
jgi:signal transduction histidine kinase